MPLHSGRRVYTPWGRGGSLPTRFPPRAYSEGIWREGSRGLATEQEIGVGTRAPGFTLMSGDREEISLSGVLAEKTAVLVFYLFDFSGG